MRTTSRRTLLLPVALLVFTLALAVGANAEGTTTVIHFQSEALPALETQLKHHEVHAVTFHPTPAPGHIHVSMADGKHFTVIYAASEQEKLIALARANGARYQVATVKAKAKKSTHHTLRYIVGGVVIVVIIVVAAVLLVDRRRKLREGEGGASGTPAAGDSAT